MTNFRTLAAMATLLLASSTAGFAQSWEFNTDGDRQGWTARNSVADLTAAGGALGGDITGPDPYIHGPTSPWFSVTGKRYLHIRMKVTAGAAAQVFWSTPLDWSFRESRSVTFNVIPDGRFREYIVDMSVNANWTGTLRQLRLDPTDASSGRFDIDFIRIAETRATFAWEFNTAGDTEGWTAGNSLSGVTASGGSLVADITGNDPYFIGPRYPDIDADFCRWLHIRMKSPAGQQAQVYWGTPEEPRHIASREAAFSIISDGEFHEYAVDMARNSQWAGTVCSLRIDPSTSAFSGQVAIDFIRVSSEPPPVLNVGVPGVRDRFAFAGEEVTVSVSVNALGFGAGSNLRATLSAPGLTVLSPATQTLTPDVNGSEHRLTWQVRAGTERVTELTVTAQADTPAVSSSASSLLVVSAARQTLPGAAPTKAEASVPGGKAAMLQNGKVRLVFTRSSFGYGLGELHIWNGSAWELAGGMAPLTSVVFRRASGQAASMALLPLAAAAADTAEGARLTFSFDQADADGVRWQGSLVWELADEADVAKASYTLSCTAPRDLLAWNGPSLAVGNRGLGVAKSEALVPGLEWLVGEEQSSNTLECDPPLNLRVVAHPYKFTVLLMCVSAGGNLAGLLWNPLQTWDGQNTTPNAKFSSPNWLEGQANHLMELFVPTTPAWMPENATRAQRPYPLPAGRILSLQAWYLARRGGGVLDAVDEWFALFGVPPVPGPSGLLESGLATARLGLMQTVWDAAARQWKHVVEWGSGPAPEFAADLFADSLSEVNPAEKAALRARVQEAVTAQIAALGAASLGSQGGSHLPEYRLPFFIGYLDEMMGQYLAEVNGLIQTQQPDGGWFVPVNPTMPRLVTPDTKELGSCANNARILLNHARLTGRTASLQAGLKALAHMDSYSVPRAAQVWEVPQHAPDILAAAWAIAAYLDGYVLTGDPRYLEKARYWARAGLHFNYAWRAPDRAIMDYASIPVYGCTFFTGPWFGLPVQWCGMVYAYYAERLSEYDTSFPWRQVSEGITRSCVQQMNVSPYLGTYGDSLNIMDSNTPNGVYINPDNIYKCAGKLLGRWGEVNKRKVTGGGRTAYVSTAARIRLATFSSSGSRLNLRLAYPAGESCFVMIHNVSHPAAVYKGPLSLNKVVDTDLFPEGWSYDSASLRLVVRTTQPAPEQTLQVVFSGPPVPLTEAVTVGQAKSLPNGTVVTFRGVVSSPAEPGGVALYVQSEDRSAGIRVNLSSPTLQRIPAGARVEVMGTLGSASPERAVVAADVRVDQLGPPPEPLGMPGRYPGGAALQPYNPGVEGGIGLHNLGLLVRTWGKVTSVGPGYLYLDDGSGLLDGTLTEGQPNVGLRVLCDPAGFQPGDIIEATGVCAPFRPSTTVHPLISTRSGGDLRKL